jgi:hypothetical protein
MKNNKPTTKNPTAKKPKLQVKKLTLTDLKQVVGAGEGGSSQDTLDAGR